jgi:hypothetical protein
MEGWRQNDSDVQTACSTRKELITDSLFARMHFDIAGSSAVKAQDELAPLGLDCAPRRPNTLAIRAKGKIV